MNHEGYRDDTPERAIWSIEEEARKKELEKKNEKQKIREENEKKKKYLREYQKHKRRVERINDELEEIRMLKMNPSINSDGMPHSHNQSDLSSYAVEITELEEKLYQEGVQQVEKYKDISYKISLLKDENERDTLFYRYIKGKEFWEIAKKMNCSERQIHRYHRDGLKNLKLVKDVSPCQSKV